MLRIAFVLLFMFCTGVAGAQQRPPRETVEAVAAAIESTYFDAKRAAEIAKDLRAQNRRGDFDTLAPADLATALTDRLKPLDRHFGVHWDAPSPAGGPRRAPAPRPDTGVRRVEVLPGNLGYLDLAFFAGFDFADKAAPPRLAIDAALQLLAWTDAVIIDLRNNGGGSPAMVGYLSSAFTPRGADIYNTFHSREGTSSEAPLDWHPAPRLEVPLYVLVSARTGSAAEALAYTLQSAGRATVVGETTAGAANPCGHVDVGHGFSVFVSDGSPVNPITKRNWEGDGVVPTLAVDPSDALRVAQVQALERVLARSTREDAMTEVRWALEALQAHGQRPVAPLAPLAGTYGDIVASADGDALLLKQGRRPVRALRPLPNGEFFYDGEPHRRVAFGRDADGRVTALELRFADGSTSRHRRTP